jgi:hypothetical protein
MRRTGEANPKKVNNPATIDGQKRGNVKKKARDYAGKKSYSAR